MNLIHTPEQITPSRPRLGIDIGRVIIANATDVDTSIFSSSNYLEAAFNEGAMEAIQTITEDSRWDQVHLVSKCGPVVQARTLEVFKHNNFFKHTGIQPANVHFCLTRLGKAPIATELGLTHFIDDRQDVLDILPDTVEHKLLFYGDLYDVPQTHNRRERMARPVAGWLNTLYALEETLAK